MEIKDDSYYICYRFDKIRVYLGSYIKHFKFEDLIILDKELSTKEDAYDIVLDYFDEELSDSLIRDQKVFDKNIILSNLKGLLANTNY